MRSMLMIAALLVTVTAVAQNLGAVNTGFEGDADGDGVADGWEFVPHDEAALDVELSLEPGREGGTCQKIECTRYEAGHVMLAQEGTVSVERGAWYRATIWARGAGQPNVGVGIHDTDGWRQCGLWRRFRPREGWRPFSWRFQGDHDCHETSRLQIWFSATGTLWVDDLTLERIEAPAGANIIEDIGAKNLLPNSSFEAGPDRWISAGCWRLFGVLDIEQPVHGDLCMRVEWSRETAPVFSFDYYDMRREPYTQPAITSEGWMRLEEGVAYVLSMYLRADRELPAHLRVHSPSGQLAAAAVTLATDWRRFELPFAAGDDLCYVQVDVDCDGAGVDEMTYWVDAVQLERGDAATDYEPRRPLEIGVVARNGSGMYFGDAMPVLDVYVANDTDDTVELPFTVSATDGFDRPVPELRETMTVPRGFVRAAIEAESLGAFNRVTIAGEGAGECAVRIARLPELNMTDSPFGINHAYGWNDYVGLAGLIGVKWVRDWSLKWDHVEPEPGTFDFAMTDSQINRPLGLGMNVLCMFPFPSAGWSSTAPPVDEIPEELSGRARYRIRTAYAPEDPAALEEYAYECVSRYRDRVNVWEVFNESIFTSYSLPQRAGYEATDYVPLLERVYAGCKRADPDCTVIGGYSVPPERFDDLHQPFIEAGGLQYCDVYSLHIYPGGEPEFIADQLDRIREAMREHGGVKPMWMTEYAYYADDDPDPVSGWPNLVESELQQAQWNTRMCVTQLAHGVEKVFYHIWHTRANRDSTARIFFEYGAAPRRIAVSQSAMARMLGPDPELLREIDIGEEASCYLFGNRVGIDGEGPALVAVAWHHWDTIDAGGLEGREVYDLFGTRVTDGLDELPGPIFVVDRDASEAALASALEEALAQ